MRAQLEEIAIQRWRDLPKRPQGREMTAQIPSKFQTHLLWPFTKTSGSQTLGFQRLNVFQSEFEWLRAFTILIFIKYVHWNKITTADAIILSKLNILMLKTSKDIISE